MEIERLNLNGELTKLLSEAQENEVRALKNLKTVTEKAAQENLNDLDAASTNQLLIAYTNSVIAAVTTSRKVIDLRMRILADAVGTVGEMMGLEFEGLPGNDLRRLARKPVENEKPC